MTKVYWSKIYVDRDPDDILKGWGWLEVKVDDIKTWSIPTIYPLTYQEKLKRLSFEEIRKMPGQGNLPGGNGTRKKFSINIDGNIITIRAQKALSNKAVCFWIKTWAPPSAKVVTPGNRELSLDGDKLTHEVHFVYFILNQGSNAIKIGRARNVDRRMKSLQTSSPAKLELIKSISVQGKYEAQDLELSLHKQFDDLRITGEWFRAEPGLIDYINQLRE
jgi:hypothetical protein